MEIKTINAALCAKMFLGGAKNLEANKEWINELNVFPVPDGDTGTNMTLTITSAAKEVASLENPEMEIVQAEKKIKAFADAHKTGSFSCVTPAESDRILREFYGLGAAGATPSGRDAPKVLNLADFL